MSLPNCSSCKENLISKEITEKHLYVTFKEYDNQERLHYASDKLINLVDRLHRDLYSFLDLHASKDSLENTFKQHCFDIYNDLYFVCSEHNIFEDIFTKIVKIFIFN
jgi:hypothetical protein